MPANATEYNAKSTGATLIATTENGTSQTVNVHVIGFYR